MTSAYFIPLDIANRALDHVGSTPITSFTQDCKAAQRTAAVYDKVRDAELRRNVWRFAIRKAALRAVDTTTMFLVPAAYSAASTYPQGSIVTYNSVTYISAQYVPTNTPPGTPNEAFWWVYFGPLTVTPWNPQPPNGSPGIPFWSSTTTYNDGQYVVGSDNLVYVCVVGTSLNQNPVGDNGVHWVYTGTSATGITVPTYYAGELVYNVTGPGVVQVYQCLTTDTLTNPTALPVLWLANVTYNTGDTVVDAFNVIWQSKIDLNIDNAPVAGAAWESVPAGQVDTQVGQDWLQINATVQFQRIQYPIGAGPRYQSTTRNIYRLPSGYKREAPQDPKAGAVSYLGAPSGLPEDDWEFEGDFIVTRDSEVIVLRFVADIQDVTRMDPMFCEGLGARIGMEVCEALTQSAEKVQTIGIEYNKFMGEARAVNGIETGPTEPPLDDYISCRI